MTSSVILPLIARRLIWYLWLAPIYLMYASDWSMFRTFHVMVQSENVHDRCQFIPEYSIRVSMLLIGHCVSLHVIYILYRLPLICPHCANVPLLGTSFNNLSPNRRYFVIWHTCCNLAPDWHSDVILFLVGAALSSWFAQFCNLGPDWRSFL